MSEVEGIYHCCDPNREIGFGFVSCSCRACVRACEVAWARKGHASSTLESRMVRCPPPPTATPVGISPWHICCYTHGF